MVVKELFSEMDNLSCFEHPKFQERYHYMTIQQQIELASLMVEKVLQSPYRRILVIETGAAPLAKLMEDVLRAKQERVTFYYLKLPRDLTEDQRSRFGRAFLNALSRFIAEPFLIFDEYIDSGHTMNLVISFLQSLGCKDHYQLLAYMNLCNDTFLNRKIFYACANKNTRADAYLKGVYPFENRLDYAPYFFTFEKKVSLEEFLSCQCKENCETFVDELLQVLKKKQLLERLKQNPSLRSIAEFLSEKHLILYTIYFWEGDPIYKQFFWLLFDMYGPCWTPLPDAYHLSYWDGFHAIKEDIFSIADSERSLFKTFSQCRKGIAHHAASTMLRRHGEWLTEIKKILWRLPC